MQVAINIITIVITIAAMELLSWAMHKYLFHGPLWFIHKTHHQERHTFLELNDIFSIAFASLALWLMWIGHISLDYHFWIGTGISIYGTIYFVFHDWFIHNRFKAFKSNNRYLMAIRRAHKIHHKSMEKKAAKEFGLLLVSRKWFS
ncbi:sterol desaturase family protein [Mucilaginibacter sp. FT3.2]|uniref:sterol desaturase family protein n=1 Tax=Mucilaginibacter sp. FT3.2 TaxID=2723090 RepID=UPI00160C2AA9|nr:sterol desaturase family protein [Mucilaginibacter sp. FT3.2]MBB6232806.1 beta-carotene 3-hydroxylase [Mucilaginibacter sp. FT3.2]